MAQKKLSEMLGIDTDTMNKSKDIIPTFDLSSLGVGDKAIMQAIAEPNPVVWEDKREKVKKTSMVLPVVVEKVVRADGTELPYNEKYGIWLSSKSLAMGIARLTENDYVQELVGKRFIVKVGLATYKNYGEARCYHVNAL